MSELTLVASLFGPLFVGLIFHGLCIKFGWLRSLAVPIDRGALFRGRALFGANKTYRGVIVVALGSAAGYSLQRLVLELQPAVLRGFPTFGLASFGFALGAAAMLSELPNSFLKRQLDIAPGAPGGGPAIALLLRRGPGRFPAGGLAGRVAVGSSHAASHPLVNSLRACGASGHQRPWGPPRHAGFGQVTEGRLTRRSTKASAVDAWTAPHHCFTARTASGVRIPR